MEEGVGEERSQSLVAWTVGRSLPDTYLVLRVQWSAEILLCRFIYILPAQKYPESMLVS